ncbi:pol, partial [Symbiodinium microadriaticum]
VVVRVMVVFDYLRWSEQDAALVEIQSEFQRSLPGLSVAMRGCWGPFEDSEGLASHFDGGANRLAGTKRVKRLRVDLLTSSAIGTCSGKRPAPLGGHQGYLGVAAALVAHPERHQEIAEFCPELQREFPEPPLRGFGVVGKIAAGDEVLRLLRLDPSKGIEEASIRGMLDEPSREMWDHDGLCACGKRTYLFSRDALPDLEVRGSPDRDPESPELGVEVNGVLAAPSEAVPNLFGSLRGKLWKGGAHLTLSRGTSTDQLKYITAWVVREGVVVLGHNSSPVDTVKSGVVLSWSVEPNWHGHRHLVNAVCESLWRASGQEVALDPAFDRLLCLI